MSHINIAACKIYNIVDLPQMHLGLMLLLHKYLVTTYWCVRCIKAHCHNIRITTVLFDMKNKYTEICVIDISGGIC